MIARIIPLLRMPRDIGIFDYLVSPSLSIVEGSVVVVPFRKKSVVGIVAGISSHSSVPEKKLLGISSIISKEPLLPPEQMAVAMRCAHDDFNSVATVLRSVLPNIAVTKKLAIPYHTEVLSDHAQARKLLDTLTNGNDDGTIVTYRTYGQKVSFYQAIAGAAKKTRTSMLIVSPTIAHAEALARAIDGVQVFHHSMSATQLRAAFVKIRSEAYATVFGTRSAVFAPLQNISAIIVDDEDDDGHVQEEPNPRYDGRRLAALLAKETGAKLIFTSYMPSLATFRSYPLRRRLGTDLERKKIIIDLDQQREMKDYGIVTERAARYLHDSFAHNGRMLVVHHRRASFGSLVCNDCGYVPTCPTCSVPLRQEHNQLVCRHCASVSPIPLHCPRCNSVSIKGRGQGIEHVVRELEKNNTHAHAFDPLRPRDRDQRNMIDVITAARASELTEGTYDLICITRFESLLSFPRADADERARRLILHLESLLTPTGTLIVQASSSSTSMIRTPNDDSWYTAALRDRERFGYPPAWKILVLRQRQGFGASVAPERLYAELSRFASSITLAAPQRSKAKSRRDAGGIMIILRYRGALLQKIHELLSRLDERWTITTNPIEID